MKRRAVDPADYEPLGPLQHRQQQSSEPLPVQSGRPQQAPPEHALPGQASRQNLHQQPNISPSQQQNGASNHHQQRGGPVHGRRQPQTSCDSCRRRKLKCDRRQPCSSCVARGLLCHGQPNAAARNIGQRYDSCPISLLPEPLFSVVIPIRFNFTMFFMTRARSRTYLFLLSVLFFGSNDRQFHHPPPKAFKSCSFSLSSASLALFSHLLSIPC